jgi:hypothetical protein
MTIREKFIKIRNFIYILLAIYLIYLAATYFMGTNAPKCGAKETVNNVFSILKKGALQDGMTEDEVSRINLKLSNIITLDKNSVGAYFCEADVILQQGDIKTTNHIKYNNRIIEDKKDAFLTTITSIN